MPATGALSGTPALSSDIVDAQTEPIEVEPLEPSASDTCRIAYGNSSRGRQHRHQRPLGERAVADLAPLRRADRGRSHRWSTAGSCSCACSACGSPGDSVSSCCSMRSMFSVVTPRIWVSPRSNSAEPCTRGSDLDLGGQGADVGEAAAVDADLVAQHPLADQLLGQASGRRRRSPSRGPRTGPRAFSAESLIGRARPRAPACRDGQRLGELVGHGGGRPPRRRRPGSPGRRGNSASAWRRARPARLLGCAQRSLMNGLAASGPRRRPPRSAHGRRRRRASTVFSVASASTIMIATSPSSSRTRPATTMSKTARPARSGSGRPPRCRRSARRGRRRSGRRTAGRTAGWTSTRR